MRLLYAKDQTKVEVKGGSKRGAPLLPYHLPLLQDPSGQVKTQTADCRLQTAKHFL